MAKKRFIIIPVLLILAGAIVAVRFVKHKEMPAPSEITLFGNIEVRQTDLSFQVPGQILEMYKDEGDSVKQGELVAVLDNRDFILAVDRAKAELDRAKALVDDAEAKYNRQAPLAGENIISKQDVETLLSTCTLAKAGYQLAETNLAYSRNQLEYTKLYAPCTGFVTVRIQEPGSAVNKGQSIYTVTKIDPVQVRTYISEKYLGNIAYGMQVTVLTDSGSIYPGTVGYISPVAEFTPKTVQTEELRTDLVYKIKINITDTDEYLRQGMPVTAKIALTAEQQE